VGLTKFHNIHDCETIWVLGSGASLNYIDPRFWDDKVCVCTNYAGVSQGLSWFYSVSQHHNDADAIARMRPDLMVFTSEVEQVPFEDRSERPASEPNVIKVPTIEQRYAAFDPFVHWPDDPDTLIVGPSSLHMALHLAVYLGASDIVVAGADCGEYDGQSRVTGYEHPDGLLHFDVWRNALEAMARKIRTFNVGVHSINPWVTPTLEGHKYRSGSATIN
jgi:hypothetical protein